MKKFIERIKNFTTATSEVVKRATALAIRASIVGGVIGAGISLFVTAPALSVMAFCAAGTSLLAGGGYFAANVLESMFSTAASKYNRKIASGALLAAASATALYFTGTPRAAAENQTASNVSATANAAFADCPAQKRVTTITQDAKGKQVVTMTCKQ